MFQSPQWGSNSKVPYKQTLEIIDVFQSPQWGSNSKAKENLWKLISSSFSPRNGEVILKKTILGATLDPLVSVPAMGK